ncbi:FMN-binding protein [Rubripirellula amarantea]|nr:FMN-binding protein [Rubripirellula amarantea]
MASFTPMRLCGSALIEKPAKRGRMTVVHTIRCCLVVALLALLPSPHRDMDASERATIPNIADIQRLLPNAATIVEPADRLGCWSVEDANGNHLGLVARTLPAAQDQRGYRGPTEALLVMDNDHVITNLCILQSHDTGDHVDAIEKDEKFFRQFVGWELGQQSTDPNSIDGVSGATLTSLAMAAGIMQRVSPSPSLAPASLVFPEPLTVNEIQTLFGAPSTATLENVVRTGPFSDSVIGYQGPTELVLQLDDSQTIVDLRIRKSFDNEPYVGYLRDDKYYWKKYIGKPLAEFRNGDELLDSVEGVSGATMTSDAVLLTTIDFASAYSKHQTETKQTQSPISSAWAGIRWSTRELASLLTLLILFCLSRSQAMKRKRFRQGWLLAVIVVIGFWSGNLVSIAWLAGAASAGVSWKLAIGLTAIASVAFIVPTFSKGNPYCNHLCPHGAIQQLVRPGTKSKRRLAIPSTLRTILSGVPAITLAASYLALLFAPQFDVSQLEPFDAYAWKVAGSVAIALAIITIAFSMFVPMGYCRMGCPTGRLIDHLRLSAASGRWTRFDSGVVVMLVIAVVTRYTSSP